MSGKPWPRLIDPVRTASADISAKIVVPKPASRSVRGGRIACSLRAPLASRPCAPTAVSCSPCSPAAPSAPSPARRWASRSRTIPARGRGRRSRVNVAGAFLLGWLVTRLQERSRCRPTGGRCSAPGSAARSRRSRRCRWSCWDARRRPRRARRWATRRRASPAGFLAVALATNLVRRRGVSAASCSGSGCSAAWARSARFLLDGAVAARVGPRVPVRDARGEPERRVRCSACSTGAALGGTRCGCSAPGCSAPTRRSAPGRSRATGGGGRALRHGAAQRRGEPGARAAARLGGPRARGGAVTHDALTLTTYFGERDAADGGIAADALMAAYARHGLRASLLLRGSEGFGVKHHLRTDRLLTLSEDLPLVAVAVDAPAAILAAAEETVRTPATGWSRSSAPRPPAVDRGAGRGDEAHRASSAAASARAGGPRTSRSSTCCAATASRARPSCSASTAPRTGAGGARASSARNAHVPLIVIAVGRGARRSPQRCPSSTRCWASRSSRSSASASASATAARLAAPHDARRPPGLVAEAHGDLRRAVARTAAASALRRAGARAARGRRRGRDRLRGIWGYHGDHAPHGDPLLQLRRRVPSWSPRSTRRSAAASASG